MMQILTNSSKHILSAVLSCILLTVWQGGNLEPYMPYNLVNKSTQEHSITKQVDTITKQVDTIWTSMGREFKLDHQVQSSQVQAEIRKLVADRSKLYSILKAAEPYIYFIHKQIRTRGLPAELALIPVIESEFNPNDHSKKGATGLWQLMPGTAHELGVKVKSSYDGRRNVVASTKAALAYFNDLGNNFNGDWHLAIAAYNCGQGKVQSAERKTGQNNFWNLPLPRETRFYVPKLLAVAAIIQNPEKYGVLLPPIHDAPYFAEVKVKKAVNLKKIADSSGISIRTLHALNPDYNHGKVIPTKGAYTLLVPIKEASAVKANLAENVVS